MAEKAKGPIPRAAAGPAEPNVEKDAPAHHVGFRASSIPTPLTPTAGQPSPVVIALPKSGSAAALLATLTPVDTRPAIEPLLKIPGVRGAAQDGAGGEVTCVGSVDASFAARSAYFLELAGLLGSELGLEGLRSFQMTGKTTRLISVTRSDGRAYHVLTDRESDPNAVLKALEGRST